MASSRTTQRDAALDLLAGLVLEDGRRWGEAADKRQWADARALLTPGSRTPYSFMTRARGWSKTTDVAGATIAAMLVQAPAGADLYAAASDRDQSALMRRAIEGFVARTPALLGRLQVDRWQVTATGSGAQLTMLAADASGAYGLRPRWLVVDELAAWPDTEAARELWLALTSAMGKVKGSRLAVITSAGSPGHWSFEQLKHARGADLWRVSEIDGPPPWASEDRLAEQRARLLPSQYERLFENRWTEGEDSLVTAADLDAALRLYEWPLAPVKGRRYFAGVDLSQTRDRTVVALCHAEPVTDDDHGLLAPPPEPAVVPVVTSVSRSLVGTVMVEREIPAGARIPKRRLERGDFFDKESLRVALNTARWGPRAPAPGDELVEAPPPRDVAHRVVLDRLDVWEGSRDRPVPISEVEAHLALLHANYAPRVLIDPWNAALLVERLRSRRVRISPFTFSAQSVGKIATNLALLLRQRAIALPAADAALRDELANVRLRESGPGRVRMDHTAGRHDDRAVAIGLAALAAAESIRSGAGVARGFTTSWRT
ncbi:MAG: terminase large subunit domain-containing protein [Thermoleophilia bacterium]